MKSNNMNKLWIPVLICFIICGVVSYFLRPMYTKMGGNSVDLSTKQEIKTAKAEIDAINKKIEQVSDLKEVEKLTAQKTDLELKIRNLGEKQEKMNDDFGDRLKKHRS